MDQHRKKSQNTATPDKLTEEILHQSEEKYRALFETIEDAYYEIDLDGNFTFFNNTLCRIYGRSKEELMGLNFRQYMDEENVQKVFQTYKKVYKTGEPRKECRLWVKRKDGAEIYVEVSISLQKDLSGQSVGFRGIVRDVTERRKVEEELKKSEEQYRLLADNITEHVWLMDLNTTQNVYFSPSVEKMYGYTYDEMKKISLRKILTTESFQKMVTGFIAEMPKALETVPPSVHKFSMELEARHRDGHRMWIDNTISFIRDENGNPTTLLGETIDITDRKLAEEKLRNEEARFRTLAEQSSDIIVLLNREGVITYENRSIEKILGLKVEERIGAKGFEYLHPDDFQLVIETYNLLSNDVHAPVQRADIRFRHINGNWRTFEAVAGNLVNDNVIEGIMLNLRDITDRKRAAEELQHTVENLRKSYSVTIQVLVSAIEMRDPYTAGHQTRAADIARSIASEMGLPKDKIDGIRMAGSIHDIGKLSIPSEILAKPTKLTKVEFSLIKEHSLSGYKILKDVESPWPLAEIVYQHHERMDGSGYPRNLKGDDIIIEARIMAVADVVEAMASHRPYRASLGIDTALQEIEKNKGILYDDVVVDACLRLFRDKGYHLT